MVLPGTGASPLVQAAIGCSAAHACSGYHGGLTSSVSSRSRLCSVGPEVEVFDVHGMVTSPGLRVLPAHLALVSRPIRLFWREAS